eukprot:TRINITY_DN6608_c0_g1_i1.p1 TRINITY_DN6608_c0_g1~~TRINITY_DN6608_c0_g1_i1.p1  ORF type:complete len:1078 (+),score=151.35 TRINITY_DN6608_c0_g1_i1:47-3280(+)
MTHLLTLVLLAITTGSASGLCCFQCSDGCESCYGCWGMTSGCNIDSLSCSGCLGTWCQEVPPEPPNVNKQMDAPGKQPRNKTEIGPKTRDLIVGSPTIKSGHIFWTGVTKKQSSNLYSVELGGTNPMLSIELSSANTTHIWDPLLDDFGRVYVAHKNQTLRSVDCISFQGNSLKRLWSVRISGQSKICISSVGFYFIASNGDLVSIQSDGTPGWISEVGATPAFSPTYIDGYVYALGAGRRVPALYKVDALHGNVIWSPTIHSHVWDPLIAANAQFVFVCSTRFSDRSKDPNDVQPTAKIEMLNSQTGDLVFDFTAAGVIRSPIVTKVASVWMLFFSTCEQAPNSDKTRNTDPFSWTKCKLWGATVTSTGLVVKWVFVPEYFIAIGLITYQNSVLYASVAAASTYGFHDKRLLSVDVTSGNISWALIPDASQANSTTASLMFSVYQSPKIPLLSIAMSVKENSEVYSYAVLPNNPHTAHPTHAPPDTDSPEDHPPEDVTTDKEASLTWFYVTLPFFSFLFVVAISAAFYYRKRSRHQDWHGSFASGKEMPLIETREGALAGIEQRGYSVIKKLGKGGFGTVYLVEGPTGSNDSEEGLYCLKQIEITSKKARSVANNEINVLKNIPRHKGTIDVIETFTEGNSAFLVLPYYKRGDLEGYINETKSDIPEHTILGYLLQLAEALDHLHTMTPPIVHRDLKPANILVSSDATSVVITDFGLASFSDATYLHTHAGTMAYMAPEAFDGPYDHRVDIWSLGCVLYALAIKRSNAKVLCVHAARKNFHDDVSSEIQNKGYSALLVDNVRQMLQMNRRARPSAEEIIHRLIDAGVVANKNHIEVLDGDLEEDTAPTDTSDIPHALRVAFAPLGSNGGTATTSSGTVFSSRDDQVPKPVIDLLSGNPTASHPNATSDSFSNTNGSRKDDDDDSENSSCAGPLLLAHNLPQVAAPRPSISLGGNVLQSPPSSDTNSTDDGEGNVPKPGIQLFPHSMMPTEKPPSSTPGCEHVVPTAGISLFPFRAPVSASDSFSTSSSCSSPLGSDTNAAVTNQCTAEQVPKPGIQLFPHAFQQPSAATNSTCSSD